MKSSSKILIGGVILLVIGFILCLYSETQMTGGVMPLGHTFMPVYDYYTVYPYRNLGIVVIILSFVCFIAAGISAAKARKKEKREQTLPLAPVQQPPPQYALQQQILQPQSAQVTQAYQQPLQQPTTQITQSAEQTAQLQYCPFCGKQLQPEWSICPYCGKKLKGG